jgi:putative ABC transport system ATP-binding protein
LSKPIAATADPPGTLKPMIRLETVSLTLATEAGPVNILRGIDLAMAPGETVAVVGPSGSGKTSLLMVIAGLERATGGLVEVAGQDLGALDEDGRARFRRDTLGIVFQSFHLIPSMTALENVAIPLELAGRWDAFNIAASLLEPVGLAARAGHYPGQLSGGEQQRVALARAFAAEPKLLLADEPTANLDLTTGERILELMFGLSRRNGTTLVLVTHDPALARRCDRIVEIADGLIVAGQVPPRRAAGG